MNLKTIRLRENSQRSTITYYMVPFIRNARKCKLICSERKQITGCLGMRQGGGSRKVFPRFELTLGFVMSRIMSPPNSCWSPNPQNLKNVTLFEDRVFIEVMTFKHNHIGGPYSNLTGVRIKRWDRDVDTQRKDPVRTLEMTAIYKPRTEDLEETSLPAPSSQTSGLRSCPSKRIRGWRIR